jgi:hypothetical protein
VSILYMSLFIMCNNRGLWAMVILLYTNFNNISVISRWFAALVDETEVR